MVYTAIISRQEDDTYTVRFPDFPKIYLNRDTLNEAIAAAKDALENQLSWNIKQGLPFKEPTLSQAGGRHAFEIEVDPLLVAACRLFEARRGQKASDIAKKMGVQPIAYTRLENREANPTLKTLAKAAKALGKTLDVRFL